MIVVAAFFLALGLWAGLHDLGAHVRKGIMYAADKWATYRGGSQ